MGTSETVESITCRQLTLFAEDSPVNLSPTPGSDEARTMTATSGRKCSALLRSYDRATSWLKMCLESSLWHSTTCFLIWKVRATPRGRLLFRLRPSMPRTDASASGSSLTLWRTPGAGWLDQRRGTEVSPTGRTLDGEHVQVGLAHQVRMVEEGLWPTPTARDYRSPNTDGRFQDQLPNAVGGLLNPAWVELLMGYPPGWTALDSGTAIGSAACPASPTGSETE
jgi:hypothetical protein